jgi:uncharacterized protein (TIGR02266 family)
VVKTKKQLRFKGLDVIEIPGKMIPLSLLLERNERMAAPDLQYRVARLTVYLIEFVKNLFEMIFQRKHKMTELSPQSKEFSTTERLIELVRGLPENDQQALLSELEKKQSGEKRKHPRKAYFMAVDYATEDRAYKDFIRDIGMGGVFIRTRMPFSVGQEISLSFPLPDQRRHVKINGEIVRAGEQGIGVRFKMNSKDQETEIESLLRML